MKQKTSKTKITARVWLRSNGYVDVAEIIDNFIEYNKSIKSGERRNYWDLLAGRKDGECNKRNGFIFPILESVRSSRKPEYLPSKNAIKRNKYEKIPLPVKQGRWKKQ